MNPDWKSIALEYHELPLTTRYRLAELEIAKALPILLVFEERKQVELLATKIFRAIQTNIRYLPEHEEEFIDCCRVRHFREGTKNELLLYFRYRNISYKAIRDVTSMSPNTIAKAQFINPHTYPVFSRWNEDMLMKWDQIKEGLNLWKQDLYHMKK
jgi:hypothetical protein